MHLGNFARATTTTAGSTHRGDDPDGLSRSVAQTCTDRLSSYASVPTGALACTPSGLGRVHQVGACRSTGAGSRANYPGRDALRRLKSLIW